MLRFLTELKALPAPADAEGLRAGLEHWREAAGPKLSQSIEAEPGGEALLHAVFGNSPFLTHALVAERQFADTLFEYGADAAFQSLILGVRTELAAEPDRKQVMRSLRIAKRRAALLIALADIGGAWPLEKVTAALSDFAEIAQQLAVAHLLDAAKTEGDIADSTVDESGYFILGMGKLGGRELNYSSDIDLIALFDPERIVYTGSRSIQEFMIRLTRDLVTILEERSDDGYVFRCDLRLRPDPGATPLAISVDAAETYYEGMGQNWERAAMIKARCVAGDLTAAGNFLKSLVPYVWRKHLDFAAIADIHSIKRQIHAHRGGGTIAVNGHDIKLGRGGIREIEFFAQTQQLIWGGRVPELRQRATCDALNALCVTERITRQAADDLIAAYRFLRRLEHRLQMVDDQQTHKLPNDDAGIARIAVFLGYQDAKSFTVELVHHLQTVERHYAALFEEEPSLSKTGNLVFTGIEPDPETLQTLGDFGFAEPEAVSQIVMGWHRGRIPATRSARAREILTELVPAILAAFAKTADPQSAFAKFDGFLARLPAGVQLFSLFQAYPVLLDLVAEIMGDAPGLADLLARRPILLDGVLSSDFGEPLAPVWILEAELNQAVSRTEGFEGVLDAARRWTEDKKFRLGVQMLRHLTAVEASGPVFADIADAVIRVMLPAVEAEFAIQHGKIPGGGMAVVGMGRLGGREMTLGSDLDLVFVYNHAKSAEQSDGPKPLGIHEYFARLSRRLINALSAPTAEGELFRVDMRLRPSGNSGPIASHIDAFRLYHKESSWTWEHLALARARVVAGPDSLKAQIEDAIRETLTRKRDVPKLARDVYDMRLRIAETYKVDSLLNVKHLRGGFVDLEFIVQYLELCYAHAHPEILSQNTREALNRLEAAGILDADAARALKNALLLWQRILGVLRLCYPEPIPAPLSAETAPKGLQQVLIRVTSAPGYSTLLTEIEQRAAAVHELFRQIIERQAGPPPDKNKPDENQMNAMTEEAK